MTEEARTALSLQTGPTRTLLVQGGALRGVYSIAAAAELQLAGLTSLFDVTVGVSSGGLNAAYVAAQQALEGVDLYCQYLTDYRFISFLRFPRSVNIDYMIDVVKGRIGPYGLQLEALRRSGTKVVVGLTRTADARSIYVELSALDDSDIWEALRATAAMPGVYDKRVLFQGATYVDGGLIETLPALRLLALNYRPLLVLTTRRSGYRSTHEPRYHSLIGPALAIRQGRTIRRWIGKPNSVLDVANEVIDERSSDHGDTVFVVRPRGDEQSRKTLDFGWRPSCNQLRDCSRMARDDVRRFLDDEGDRLLAVLTSPAHEGRRP